VLSVRTTMQRTTAGFVAGGSASMAAHSLRPAPVFSYAAWDKQHLAMDINAVNGAKVRPLSLEDGSTG